MAGLPPSGPKSNPRALGVKKGGKRENFPDTMSGMSSRDGEEVKSPTAGQDQGPDQERGEGKTPPQIARGKGGRRDGEKVTLQVLRQGKEGTLHLHQG